MGVRGHNAPVDQSLGGTESLRGRRKITTMSQVLSLIQYICSQKSLSSNMGAPNLLLALGAVDTPQLKRTLNSPSTRKNN